MIYICVCVCVCVCICAYLLSPVRLFVTPWAVAHQAPLSMGVLQARILECVAMPSSGDHPNPRIELRSSALQADSLPSEPPGKPELTSSLYDFYSITFSNLQSTILFIYCIHWVLSPSSPIKYKNLHKKVTFIYCVH